MTKKQYFEKQSKLIMKKIFLLSIFIIIISCSTLTKNTVNYIDNSIAYNEKEFELSEDLNQKLEKCINNNDQNYRVYTRDSIEIWLFRIDKMIEEAYFNQKWYLMEVLIIKKLEDKISYTTKFFRSINKSTKKIGYTTEYSDNINLLINEINNCYYGRQQD